MISRICSTLSNQEKKLRMISLRSPAIFSETECQLSESSILHRLVLPQMTFTCLLYHISNAGVSPLGLRYKVIQISRIPDTLIGTREGSFGRFLLRYLSGLRGGSDRNARDDSFLRAHNRALCMLLVSEGLGTFKGFTL